MYYLVPVIGSMREKQSDVVVTNHLVYLGPKVQVSCQRLHHTQGLIS